MKKELMVMASVIGFATVSAQAVKINGTINFDGSAELTPNPVIVPGQSLLEGAIGVESWVDFPTIEEATGDFTLDGPGGALNPDTEADDPVMFNAPWVFGSGLSPLWEVGGFTFNLTSSNIEFQSDFALIVNGTGVAFGNGFEETDGNWVFAITNADQGANGTFNFTADAATIPDGGATVALFGLALLGLPILRKKLAK